MNWGASTLTSPFTATGATRLSRLPVPRLIVSLPMPPLMGTGVPAAVALTSIVSAPPKPKMFSSSIARKEIARHRGQRGLWVPAACRRWPGPVEFPRPLPPSAKIKAT